MSRHIFLTGKKQVGKSTLLKKVLNAHEGKIGGFFTVRTNAYLQDRYSVHLYAMGDKPIACESNLLFVCETPDSNLTERFNRLGCQALAASSDATLLVMDELGPHEAKASLFKQQVLSRLEGKIPVIGVLQEPAEAYWEEVVQHPKVAVIEITKQNRNNPYIIRQMMETIQEI